MKQKPGTLNVLLLTDGVTPFEMGGMQKHSYFIAKYLAKEKISVMLVHCITGKNEPLPQKYPQFSEEELKYIEPIALHFPRSLKFPGHYVYNSYRYSAAVYDHIKDRLDNFDFIYAKGFAGWKLLQQKRKGLHCPPVGVKFHGMNMFYKAYNLKNTWQNALLKPFVKQNMRMADHVFSYGGKVTGKILEAGVLKNKIIEVPTGIEKQWLKPASSVKPMPPGHTVKFLFVGRYDPVKGIEELNKAILQLKSGKFEFHFIGPFPVQKQVRGQKVFYHGPVHEHEKLRATMDKMDVLVLPSYSEGMPNVILEAMARGLAILATDVGANALMVDTANGMLIDRPEENTIKNAMHRFITADPETLADMKRNSIGKIKDRFTWEAIARQLVQKLKAVGKSHLK